MNLIKGFKEVYQRLFKAVTPTYFKRIFWAAITFLAAPELLMVVTTVINEPEYMPTFMHADWFKVFRGICLGAAFVSKMTVHWGKTDLEKVPDVSKPVDVIVNEENEQV